MLQVESSNGWTLLYGILELHLLSPHYLFPIVLGVKVVGDENFHTSESQMSAKSDKLFQKWGRGAYGNNRRVTAKVCGLDLKKVSG